MNRFAQLLDRLAFEHARNAKLRLMADYFRTIPDPERGWALAALTGSLSFAHAKPGLIRALVMERIDPVLFGWSYDYVGDLAETVALLWPPLLPLPVGERAGVRGFESAEGTGTPSPDALRASTSPLRGEVTHLHAPSLTDVVAALATLGKSELPGRLAGWLDALDETGRWALLKLVTSGLRIGVSARLTKTAVASLRDKAPDEIELLWPALAPPYVELFAWVEGRGAKPDNVNPLAFRPAMLAHAIEETEFAALDPADYLAEWKWDGIRVQAVANGKVPARLYSRTGEDISKSFPDLTAALRFDGSIDGELLVMRDRRVQPFNSLQQRLNRKAVTDKLMTEFPAHLRAYDVLVDGADDLRDRPFVERRARLEAFVARIASPRLDLSPLVAFSTWEELAAARADPASHGAGADADAVEGVMLKRRDAPYVPGRPKGLWWKWKRGPILIDAVLMYAQRGSGKRSSYYSDYTFGVWRRREDGDELVPVGKAYFGFTDDELLQIDRFVRRNTVDRFGPVREVVHAPDKGLVMEVAFEGLARSNRHKSGIAMRFPRINRLRWDKPPAEADRLETLERLLDGTPDGA